MRKHKHDPHFTKRSFSEPLKNFHYGRRAHRLMPREAPAQSVIDRAAKRARLYMHSSARRRSA